MLGRVLWKVRRALLGSQRKDPAEIDRFNKNPASTYLVSFPRTGSHWLRMLIELYFERPLLVRTFFFPRRRDYLLLHTHDMDLEVERQNVIYLYRDPVDTVYSLLKYHGQSTEDRAWSLHWCRLYARHLDKWLHKECFTRKKTVARYARLKEAMCEEFAKICLHFGVAFDPTRLKQAAARVSKERVAQKTRHDPNVMAASPAYEADRRLFRQKHGDCVWEAILEGRAYLRDDF